MNNGPLRPAEVLVGWLTFIGAVVALVLLIRSHEPLGVKVGLVGLTAAGIGAIAFFYLGGRRERSRLSRRIRALERELERAESGPPSDAGKN